MRFLWFLFFVCCLTPSLWAFTVADSIGTERIGNKLFIRYQVTHYEDVLDIANKYGITLKTLLYYNPNFKRKRVSKGDVLRIPYKNLTNNEQVTTQSDQLKIYQVQAGEGLYAIARKFGMSVNKLLIINQLSINSNLSVGQRLLIETDLESDELRPALANELPPSLSLVAKNHRVVAGETLYKISKQYQVSLDSLTVWNDLRGNAIAEGTLLKVGYQLEKPFSDLAIIPYQTSNKKFVKKTATAEMIAYDSQHKVALHKTIPRNTIVRVYNPTNDSSVEVKIIGELPDTSANENIEMKISQAACQQLGVVNKRFPVILFYHLETGN